MIILDELTHQRYEKREDGTLVPIPVELVYPPELPVHEFVVALPDWLESDRREAAEIFEDRRAFERTAHGRSILAEFDARLAKHRAEVLASLHAIDNPPAGHRVKYVFASPECNPILRFKVTLHQWLTVTADPEITAAGLKFYNEWDSLQSGYALRRDRPHVTASGPLGPNVDVGLAAANRWRIYTLRYQGRAQAVREAQFKCDALKIAYASRQQALDSLKAIHEGVDASAIEAFHALLWQDINRRASPDAPTYADYRDGKDVYPWQREQFEIACQENWNGSWPN